MDLYHRMKFQLHLKSEYPNYTTITAMKTRSIFTFLFAILLCLSTTDAKHIIGGYMSYSVVSMNSSSFEVDVDLSVFRDPYGGGTEFSNIIILALYRIGASGELLYEGTYSSSLQEISQIESDLLNCRGVIPEYQLGRYNMQITIPNNGSDYQLAYQRCCRSNSILGIAEVEDSGMLFTTRINSSSLSALNTSPTLTDVDNRFFNVHQTYNIDMSFIDVDGDEIVVTPLTPYEVGGLDGVNGGDANSCEGIMPDPANCPPLFDQITYTSGYSLATPFGNNGELIDEGNGNFSFSSEQIGMYLLGFKIEEFRNGELLTSSNYETTIFLSLKDDKVVHGQLYLDENENGVYDAGELPFPIRPEVLNDYCNYFIDEYQKYELLLEPAVADFQNTALNYTFSSGTNFISSPELNINQATEFDIGFIAGKTNEELTIDIYNELSLCNQEGVFTVELFNLGTVSTEGEVVISNINNLTILSCDCDYEEVGDDIAVQISSLGPLSKKILIFNVLYADENSVGEPVTATASYTSSIDPNVIAFTNFEDILFCSYDPNDIAATPARAPHFIVENDERLIVKIRFENMGNYFANSVALNQLVDENLNQASIKVLKSSHDYKFMTSRDNLDSSINFLFDNINLPGTNSPVQAEREGFIIYSIDIKPERSLGTIIENKAEIIFDINQPIITNTFTNVIGILDDPTIGEKQDFSALTIFPNPVKEGIYVKNGNSFVRYYISNTAQKYLSEGQVKYNISTANLIPGIYMITFVNKNGYKESRKFVKTK
jgi:hypothetical protein